MKRALLLSLLWALPGGATGQAVPGGQTPARATVAEDSAAVRRAALDYIDGWYTADGARMQRALHPDLEKRIVNTSGGRSSLGQMGAQTLVEMTAAGGGSRTPTTARQEDYTLLELDRDLAVARVVATSWVDYLQLARWNGEWKIVNVLWEMKPPPDPAAAPAAPGLPTAPAKAAPLPPADTSGLRAAALDYIEGWFAGDAERVRRVIHPELAKRIVRTQHGASQLEHVSALRFLDYARAGGASRLPPGRRTADIAVLDAYRNVAMVRIGTPGWVEHLQFARWNGQWRVINVLWDEKPG